MSFHINPESGEPGPCGATIRCPFGGESEHYPTKDAARSAYEATQSTFASDPEEAEALKEYKVAAEARRKERVENLREAKDYFFAAAQGFYNPNHPLPTPQEVEEARNSTVQEAVAYGKSLKGFTTNQLLDQLTTRTDRAHPSGRTNLAIRKELRARVTGDYEIPKVELSSVADYQEAYDRGAFVETSVMTPEDARIAADLREQGGTAWHASASKLPLAGFTSKELISSLAESEANPAIDAFVRARMTLELKTRLLFEEKFTDESESPF